MKSFVFLLVTCFHFSVSSQIVTNNPQQVSGKLKKKDSLSTLYLDFQQLSTSPNLLQNTDFLTIPLGERAYETPLKVWSFQAGICAPITKHFSIDGGLAWMQNGEQYNWTSNSTDSSYAYTTKYRYFGMPLQLKYQTGKDFVFFIGAGLSPQLFQSYQQDIRWTDSLGNASKQSLKDENMCETFVLSAIASTGIQMHFKSNYGLRLSVQYRHQLSNGYGPYQYFKYFTTGIGGGIALTRKF